MPRVSHLQTNFTAGELSPRLFARVDVAKYANGAKRMVNMIPVVQGGAYRRPGFARKSLTKLQAQKARLVPIVFSRSEANVLEFGHLYVRIWNSNGVYSGVELVTAFAEADLPGLDFAPSGDALYIAHASGIYRLLRGGLWRLELAPFESKPIDDVGIRLPSRLNAVTFTTGPNQIITAPDDLVFLPADVGRDLQSNDGGLATITSYSSPSVVFANVKRVFPTAMNAIGAWRLTGTPQTSCTPSVAEPVGASVVLTLPAIRSTQAPWALSGLSWSAGTATATITAHGYTTGDTVQFAGNLPAGFDGTHVITVVDANTVTYAIPNPGVAEVLGTAARVVVSSGAGWRQGDVGSFVRINGGLIRITQWLSANAVKGEIVRKLVATTSAPAGGWELQQEVWNQWDGWPRTICFHEQRLIAAGSPAFPTRVWGSAIGLPLTFAGGTDDDDPFAFDVTNTEERNPIAYVASQQALAIFGEGAESTASGGIEKGIGQANVQMRPRSNHGCARVRPARVRRELFFVERGGRKVRAFGYAAAADDFNAPDVTVLSEHITESGVVEMAYQRTPEPILWTLRTDGALAGLLIERDQDVAAWFRVETDGVVESIAVIPVGSAEQLWAIVRRVINGVTVRAVEVLDATVSVDSAVRLTGAPASTWIGLSALEGRQVDVLADGVYVGRKTVTSGAITLTEPASVVLAGLPFTAFVELLPPEVGTGTGTAMGNAMRVTEVTAYVLQSTGLMVDGKRVPFREFGADALDTVPGPRTTLVRHDLMGGWARDGITTRIEQPDPLPFHLLAVMRKLATND